MARANKIRLGVNVDHIATIRNARGGNVPDPIRAAHLAEAAGADGITAHLREDRRHISDGDIARLVETLTLPLNLEMAATSEMLEIALRHKPNACCLVPEKRQEITTEGGLDIVAEAKDLADYVAALQAASIRVSLFIDPDEAQINAAAALGVECVELHTGTYCAAFGTADEAAQWGRLQTGASLAASLGLEVHAGHGLNFETAEAVARLPEIMELNIGHFLISEGVFIGLAEAIAKMRTHIYKHSGGVQ